MEEVMFVDLKGNQILGTISIPEQARVVVIISHGFTASKESKLYVELQNELNKIGIGTLRYDYYGHGKMYCDNAKYTVTKDVTLSKCVDSINAAISFVRSQGNYSIGLVGSSFGGLISLIAASQDPEIRALVLKSSVTEPIAFWKQRLGDERIKKWKQEGIMHYDKHGENFELNYSFWEDLITYNTYKMAKNIACPILIIHGGNDSVVPLKQSQDLARIVNTEVNVVEGANHDYTNPSQYTKMKKLIIDFFVEKLSPILP
jgi:alpha-beta hydrolase superfamily lysophospholipase